MVMMIFQFVFGIDLTHGMAMKAQLVKHKMMFTVTTTSVEDVEEFLYGRGHTREAVQIGPCIDALVSSQI